MKVDRLNTSITVQRKTKASGVYVGITWATFATAKCKWVAINSVEISKSNTTEGYEYASIIMRKLSGLNATCQILRGTEVWQIIGSPKLVDNIWIEFKVQRAVAG